MRLLAFPQKIKRALVLCLLNGWCFAARFFGPGEARATSISRSGSVRSEQRSLERKGLPPFGLRPVWPVASLLVGHSPTAGMLPPRASPQAKLGATKHQPFRRHNTSLSAPSQRHTGFVAIRRGPHGSLQDAFSAEARFCCEP